MIFIIIWVNILSFLNAICINDNHREIKKLEERIKKLEKNNETS